MRGNSGPQYLCLGCGQIRGGGNYLHLMVGVASAAGAGNGLTIVAGLLFFWLMPLLGDLFGGFLLVGIVP